jgi:hypothetical protein
MDDIDGMSRVPSSARARDPLSSSAVIAALMSKTELEEAP